MINYQELSSTGTALEQLIREILLFSGFKPHWTGVGPDQGRDITFIEELTGPLSNSKRKWLVQCKHSAHSGKSVGRSDVGDFVSDCRQCGATGYLLVSTTQISSGLQTKLSEVQNNVDDIESICVWDSVEIEKRLLEPRNFALCHIFFPVSFSNTPWKIYNRGEPNKWSAHYKDYFILLHSRISGRYPVLDECEEIFERMEAVQIDNPEEFIRPRAIFYDDKHDTYMVYVDYMHPSKTKPSIGNDQLLDLLQDFSSLSDGAHYTSWDVTYRQYWGNSDHYDKDHYDYYCDHMAAYEAGMMRIPFWKKRNGDFKIITR